MDLDSIWDAPVAPAVRTPPRTPSDDDILARPAKRRRASDLFLGDGSDDDGADDGPKAPSKPRGHAHTTPSEIDAMFEDIDDVLSEGDPRTPTSGHADKDDDHDVGGFAKLAPALDTRQIRRQADARNTALIGSSSPAMRVPIMSSSSPAPEGEKGGQGTGGRKGKRGETKEKTPIAKLDEERLLGTSGFPALILDSKSFKSRGKGNELADLNQLMGIYQFWSHKMFPKTQFKETVGRIEKLCHTRRMNVTLGVWRDEAHGIVSSGKLKDMDENPTSDTDPANERRQNDAGNDNDDGNARYVSPAPTRLRQHLLSSAPPSPQLPSSSQHARDDDFDDDFIEEMMRHEAGAAIPSSTRPPASTRTSSELEDDMWEGWDDGSLDDSLINRTGSRGARLHHPQLPPSARSFRHSSDFFTSDPDEDENMLELMRERDEEEVIEVDASRKDPSTSTSRQSSNLFISDPDEHIRQRGDVAKDATEPTMPHGKLTAEAPEGSNFVMRTTQAQQQADDEWGDMYLDE